jgi:calcium-dependent protein kinase
MSLFVKMSTNEEQVKALTKKFVELDLNGSGMIDLEEFKTFFQKHHSDLSDAELKKIINELDVYGNGKINYSEFLAATVNDKTFFNEAKLKSVYSMFDMDASGVITADNLFTAF